MIPVLSSVLSLALALGAAAAQTPPPQMPPELQKAQALFQAQKWAEAAAAYESIVKTDRTDPRPRAGLAASLYAMGEYERALPFALDANRMLDDPKTQLDYPGLPPGAVMVRIARIHNRLGRTDEAFAWLDKAVSYPIPNAAALDSEPDMANLRADARWAKFAASLKASIDPCGTRPEFHQFDFWLGDWDVIGGSGQTVGSSRVERILANCVLLETYTAAPGSSVQAAYVGKAFHFFDPNTNTWVQHYIDTTAVPFDWIGELKDGALVYTREGPYGPKNSAVRQRMTFTPLPDGKVRQLFEQSADDGKTWRTGFNGTYVRRAATAPGGDPVTDAARALFPEHRRNIIGAFTAMPEAKYGFRPTAELMTFGELATHIASAHLYYCRRLGGPAPPTSRPKPTDPKADLLRVLEQSLDYCAPIVAAAKEATLGDPAQVMSGTPPTRAMVLLQLLSGMDHHYGQAAGYLRLNGVVPPTAVNGGSR